MTVTVEQSKKSSGQASHRLEHLAEALRPERSPWHVRRVAASLEPYFPAEGWYWIPTGAVTAEFLGRDAGVCEHRLRGMLEQADGQ